MDAEHVESDMELSSFFLSSFAFPFVGRPTVALETRIKRFLEAEPTTESLDTATFAQIVGSAPKADYLLAQRRFVAELKTLNGDPKDRIEQRLRERFARDDAPVVFGTLGLSRVLQGMTDEQQISKMVNDLSSRSVRRHLHKSNDQIWNTKRQLRLGDAAGLTIIMNDSEPMIDAANIGYAIKAAIDAVEGGYPEVSYVWVSVECHRITMPDDREGFPQLLVSRTKERPAEFRSLVQLLAMWAAFNGSRLQHVPTPEGWDTLRPIFDGGPPALKIF